MFLFSLRQFQAEKERTSNVYVEQDQFSTLRLTPRRLVALDKTPVHLTAVTSLSCRNALQAFAWS